MGLKGWLSGPSSKRGKTETGQEVVQLDKQRLAVLPMANVSPDPHDEYFADGLTEELITTPSQLRGLRVIARTSVIPYKGASKRVSEIGRELEVGSILEGSVRKVANKIRVTTQLIETATETHIWSSTYDRELDDIFAIQSDIAKRVAQALQVELHTGEERRIHRVLTKDLEAYELYLRGRQLMYDRTEKSLSEAQQQFERAFTRDPEFAAAYAGFADCLYLRVGSRVGSGEHPGKEMYPTSKGMVARALELDENLAEAHSTMGALLMAGYEWAKSEFEFKRAISLNPSYAQAHHWYAFLMATLGRFDEAFLEMELARKTDPFSPVIAAATGLLYWFAGRDEEALKHWLAVKEQMPGNHLVYLDLGLYFLDKGRNKEAFENLTSPVWATQSSEARYKSNLAYSYAVSGQREEALKLLADLENLQKRRYVGPFAFAMVYLGLGDNDRFFDYMTRYVKEEEGGIGGMPYSPYFKRVRSDPRFSLLLRKMNLEP